MIIYAAFHLKPKGDTQTPSLLQKNRHLLNTPSFSSFQPLESPGVCLCPPSVFADGLGFVPEGRKQDPMSLESADSLKKKTLGRGIELCSTPELLLVTLLAQKDPKL